MLGPPPSGVQQPFPAQHLPALEAVWPQTAGWSSGQEHVPAAQLAPVGQTRPQEPQFVASVCVSTQASSQTVSPVGHWHVPEEQVAPVAHAVPHAPQFAGSLERSAQTVGAVGGHSVVPDGHWHAPALQISFVSGQTFPHAAVASVPQFRASFRPSTHHGTCDGPHVMYAPQSHVPAAHVPTSPHSIPHPPQFLGSVWYVAGSTHAPLQTTCPVGHPQAPAVQTPPLGQVVPHAPQLSGSVERSTQMLRHWVWPEAHSSEPEPQPAHRERKAAAASRASVRDERVMDR